jgi:hypothetical protein
MGQHRKSSELRLPRRVREDWLHDEGYARSEMKAADAAANRIKRQRQESSKDKASYEQAKETVTRKLKRWILHAPSNKELYQKWKQEQEGLMTSNTDKMISCST